MARTIILHIANDDPVLCEMEQDPQPSDNFVVVNNLRRKDGKEINYISPSCTAVLFPWTRITFIEYMVDEEERGKVIDFFRLE